MEGLQDELTPALNTARRTNFQSIECFMKEQDELDTLRASDAATYLASSPTKKWKKAAQKVELELLKAEKKQKAALESEKSMIEEQANEAVNELGVENWVGKLLEYRNAHPTPARGLSYAEEVVPQIQPRFKCTVVISESSQHFGGTISFSKKKDAKRHASKQAVDWLIENKFMPTDGSVKFAKLPPPPVTKTIGPIQPATSSPNASPKPAISYAGQVPELCVRLGFNMPTYRITKHKETSAFWDGYAYFGGDPRIEGKVGEVKNVFGKGNAKEQIAMEVLSFLRNIERQRMEIDDEERKRKRSSMSPELGENSGKFVKVEV